MWLKSSEEAWIQKLGAYILRLGILGLGSVEVKVKWDSMEGEAKALVKYTLLDFWPAGFRNKFRRN